VELQIENVSKVYPDGTEALTDVSLTIEPGLLGLLGPNGAGKSTLMHLIATITAPTTGTVRWNGTDVTEHPAAVRAILGYLPQNFGVYPSLTAPEFLEYMAALKGLPASNARDRIDTLLTLVNLDDARDQPLGGYSGGMTQRVGIAYALLNDPALLVADEPTVGLDPAERVRFRNLLADLADDRVVLLSTHIVSDVEATATHLAVLDDGRLAADASPETLLDRVRGRVWEWTVDRAELSAVREAYPVTKTARRPEGVLVRAAAPERPVPDADPAEPTLEDAYLSLLNGSSGPS
jgi:ABC-2 type transport system ATP-binding protein